MLDDMVEQFGHQLRCKVDIVEILNLILQSFSTAWLTNCDKKYLNVDMLTFHWYDNVCSLKSSWNALLKII